ncbi:T9SS type A sorting domain-containing protein [Flavobacteriaceae bacterium]|nr:T9SS type A sorting domain-containing protein [Flavobacteriaceae bacterium]MDC0118165.1 T9SS type A sorting domain-containing protein [bacterium]
MRNFLLLLLFVFCSTFSYSQSWDYLGYAGFSDDTANYLSLAIDSQSQEVYVAYQDISCDGNLSITKHQEATDIWGQDENDTTPLYQCDGTQGYANLIDLNIDDDGEIYLSVTDGGFNDFIRFISSESNGTWANNYFGGTTSGCSVNTSIKIDYDNARYFVYYNGRIKFRRESVEATITDDINITSLSFDFKYGTGYVAYSNLSDGGMIDIQKLDTNDSVETYENISDGLSNYIDLVINPLTLQPYIAYQDIANGGGVTVKKLNDDTWGLVGQQAFSDGLANYVDLAFDVNGVPYVAFQDVSFSNKLSVMTYNGTTWEYVGERGVSPASASYCSIELDSDGEIFVAFKDGSVSNKASVLRFGAALSIDDNDLNNYVLSPNPANDKLTIDGVSDYDAKIYNNLGQFVMETTNTNTIDVSTLSKGIYFIKVSDGINSSTKKFIKN